MRSNPHTQRWERAESEVLLVGLLFLVFGGCTFSAILQDASSPVWRAVLGVIAAVLVIALVAWYKRRQGLVTKIYYVKLQAAGQVVGHVLQQKGLPFHQVSQLTTFRPVMVFKLPDDEVTVQVREYASRYASGVRVDIGPVTRENRPLVKSLQEKIDNAFAPKGLA